MLREELLVDFGVEPENAHFDSVGSELGRKILDEYAGAGLEELVASFWTCSKISIRASVNSRLVEIGRIKSPLCDAHRRVAKFEFRPSDAGSTRENFVPHVPVWLTAEKRRGASPVRFIDGLCGSGTIPESLLVFLDPRFIAKGAQGWHSLAGQHDHARLATLGAQNRIQADRRGEPCAFSVLQTGRKPRELFKRIEVRKLKRRQPLEVCQRL